MKFTLDYDVKEFLKNNIKLLDELRFKELYDIAFFEFTSARFIGNITDCMLDMGVDVLAHLKHIPSAFHCKGELDWNLLLPDHITAIEDRAFFLSNITAFTCRETSSLDYIGMNAFCGCKYLESVTLPPSCKLIGSEAFESCENLKSVVILNDDTCIQWNSFKNCPNMTIYCHKGSSAEKHALKYNINHVSI